ncbi:MAG: nucleotidyltransferase domain-containing protein [Methanomassiliicoccaceae archaeon]|nr:nucleotidyltransferase domain-containing protein [Methanomassiliicoccaceae archaeon]
MSSTAHRRHTIEELRSIVAPVAEKYGVDKIYLFGSVARGDHNENSDYDFCIEKGKIRSIFTFSGFFKQMEDAIGHEIDIVTTKGVPPEILGEIIKGSVVVYG